MRAVLLLLFALYGCTAQQALNRPAPADPTQTLAQFTQTDLATAIQIATANGDIVAVGCYTALQNTLARVVAIGTTKPTGAVSVFETARIASIQFQGGIPEAVHVACAPLVVDAETTVARLAVLIKP